MNVPGALVRLYPPAIRARWGAEIAHEARLAGPRTWFDTAFGALKSWLHPADWPEPVTGQTSRVVLAAFAAVLASAAMLVRAFGMAGLGRGTTLAAGGWLVPVMAGAVLASPVPELTWAAARRVAAAARTLAAPALALAALFLIARCGFVVDAGGATHAVLVVYYWATIIFVSWCLCRFVARLGGITSPPGRRRMGFALVSAGSGLAIAAAQAAFGAGSLVMAGGFAALAAVLLGAGRDLCRAFS
ncbi:hypothetical protein [Amycolatopsis sp. NPDC004378]